MVGSFTGRTMSDKSANLRSDNGEISSNELLKKIVKVAK